MARPSQNLDRVLLEAGFAELERGGVRGLSVRAVCARAGVNVRMLNYHFGSKNEFVRQLLNKTYQYFFNELSTSVQQNGAPLDRLACALRLIARFAVENRALTRNLWMDVNAGVPLVLEEIRRHGLRHIRLRYDLLAEAWEAGDLRRDIPVRQIFLAVIPGVFAPLMWRERVLPFGLTINSNIFPETDEPSSPDLVETLLQNFACLLEGFRARPTDGVSPPPDRARPEASQGRAASRFSSVQPPSGRSKEPRRSRRGVNRPPGLNPPAACCVVAGPESNRPDPP